MDSNTLEAKVRIGLFVSTPTHHTAKQNAHKYTHTNTHIHIHAHTPTHTNTHTHTRTTTHTHIHAHTHTYTHITPPGNKKNQKTYEEINFTASNVASPDTSQGNNSFVQWTATSRTCAGRVRARERKHKIQHGIR